MKLLTEYFKYIIIPVGIIIISVLLYGIANLFLPLDLSQDYRIIQGNENIVLVRNWGWGNQCYKRNFWGLKRIGEEQADIHDNAHKSDSALNQLTGLINTDNEISQAIYSPDKKYILYRETEYGYTGSGMTDDEYCYYRVYEMENGKIITIYQAYREWYNLFWKEENVSSW